MPTATSASSHGHAGRLHRRRRQPPSAGNQCPAARPRRPPPGHPEPMPTTHVVVPGMRQLVGDHDERLVLGQAVDEGVVEHHPAGVAEPGHVGVQRRRTTGGVGHQHVVDVHPLPRRPGRGPPVRRGESGSGVNSLNTGSTTHRVDERAEHHQPAQRRAGHGRPGPSPPAGAPDEHQHGQRRHHHLDAPGRGPRRRGRPPTTASRGRCRAVRVQARAANGRVASRPISSTSATA